MKRIKEIAIILAVLFLGTYVIWATVSTQTTKVSFACNGSTTTFSATGGNKIPCFAATDIEVYIRTDSTGAQSLLTLTSDYSVTAFNNDFTNGFTVTTVATYASGKTLVVKRSIALTQEVNLIRGRAIPAEPMERTLDRQILALQDKVEELGRALRIPVTDSGVSTEIVNSVSRANTRLGFDASGDVAVYDDSGAGYIHTDYTNNLYTSTSPVFNVKHPDYGAVGDGTTDDYTAIQAAIDAAEAATYGGTVYFPAGKFISKTELTVVNGGTKGIHLVGAGGHASIIEAPTSGFTGDAIINMTCSGPSVKVSDLVIQAAVGGNRNIDAIKATGNGMIFDNLWVSSCSVGLHLTDATNIRVNNVLSELNNYNFKVDTCTTGVVFTNCQTYQSTLAGYWLTGQKTLTGSETQGAIVICGGSLIEDGRGGDGSMAAIYIDTNIHVNITGIEIMSYNNAVPEIGIRTTANADRVTISNPTISHCKIAGIKNVSPCFLTVQGGLIYKTGYYDQSSPWATYGIWHVGNGGGLNVIGTRIEQSAGYGIHTQAPYNTIIGVDFFACVEGGSDGGGVDSTTGDKVLYLDPLANYFSARIVGCHFTGASGATAGKTAVYLGNTATPSSNNIQFVANDVDSNIYANHFETSFSDTILSQICQFSANARLRKEPIGTFEDALVTPVVIGGKVFKTGTSGITITAFYWGTEGDEITIISKGAIVFDTSTASRLIGSSVDITTASGDITLWICEIGGTSSSVWRLKGFVDVSVDNSSGA